MSAAGDRRVKVALSASSVMVTISSAQVADSACYTLTLKNEYGEDSANVQLQVTGMKIIANMNSFIHSLLV